MKLLGIATHSISSAYQYLTTSKKKILVLHYNLKRLKNKQFIKRLQQADILLIDGVRTYQSFLPHINKCPAAMVIFDNPILLQRQQPIQLLDVAPADDPLKFQFNPGQINYDAILQALKQPNLGPVIPADKTDILETIVKSYSTSGLMDKFNTYLYAAATPHVRPKVRAVVVQYIFGKLSEEDLRQGVVKAGVKNSAKFIDLLNKIVEYMTSAAGQQLQKAVLYALEMEKQADKNSRRTIAYKTIADKFNVDKFELRNLIILYRNAK